jgi:hypothetical protein
MGAEIALFRTDFSFRICFILLPEKEVATRNPFFSSLLLLMSCTDTLAPNFFDEFSKWLGGKMGNEVGL